MHVLPTLTFRLSLPSTSRSIYVSRGIPWNGHLHNGLQKQFYTHIHMYVYKVASLRPVCEANSFIHSLQSLIHSFTAIIFYWCIVILIDWHVYKQLSITKIVSDTEYRTWQAGWGWGNYSIEITSAKLNRMVQWLLIETPASLHNLRNFIFIVSCSLKHARESQIRMKRPYRNASCPGITVRTWRYSTGAQQRCAAAAATHPWMHAHSRTRRHGLPLNPLQKVVRIRL